ncbi:uncharacterized protein PG998_003549 [Apiospora kogelbergensis]|uniref:DUF427 domain-containing protein n=1 Tax=Apiospora kogelbergensis TaxID=1337665 RepID=A0AAW0QTM1_9PEZI
MPTHGHAVATVNGNVIAETDVYETVEGNVYFPPGSVKSEYFTKTDHSTHCPWKGDASYYNITVGGDELKNAAWYYPETKEKAAHFKDYVAFYKTKVDVSTG